MGLALAALTLKAAHTIRFIAPNVTPPHHPKPTKKAPGCLDAELSAAGMGLELRSSEARALLDDLAHLGASILISLDRMGPSG